MSLIKPLKNELQIIFGLVFTNRLNCVPNLDISLIRILKRGFYYKIYIKYIWKQHKTSTPQTVFPITPVEKIT